MIRTFTITARKKLLVLFKCSHCGKINIQLTDLSLEQKYDDKAFTQAGQQRQQDSNTTKLQEKMQRLEAKLLDKPGSITFAQAKFKCKCDKCGARQPWSQMNYTWIWMIAGVIGVYILGMFLGMSNEDASWRFVRDIQTIYLPMGIGALVLLFAGAGLHFLLKLIKYRSSTVDSPVLFARTVDELQKKAASVEAYRDAFTNLK